LNKTTLIYLAIGWILTTTSLAAGQAYQPVGTDSTFEMATWNIEWFGSTGGGPSNDAAQINYASAVIQSSQVDIWSLQEIANQAAFEKLLTNLGSDWTGYRGGTADDQELAIVWDKRTVTGRSIKTILNGSGYEFAYRYPMQLEADIQIGDRTERVYVIALHMKAFSDVSSYNRRVDASIRLKAYIDALLGSEMVAVMGDFNDMFTRSITSGKPSPYADFLSDSDHYIVATLPMEQANTATYCNNSTCSNGSTIDHILLTNEWERYVRPSETQRYESLLSDLPTFVYSTSDHMPVVAHVAYVSPVDREVIADSDRTLSLYPNPVHDHVTIEGPAGAEFQIVDVLGRQIGRVSLDTAGWGRWLPPAPPAPGVYFVVPMGSGRGATHQGGDTTYPGSSGPAQAQHEHPTPVRTFIVR
jgi:endonuclease/exonuclease/phosphatase family metal-dependent hydrolase